jgi:hypothetical protein
VYGSTAIGTAAQLENVENSSLAGHRVARVGMLAIALSLFRKRTGQPLRFRPPDLGAFPTARTRAPEGEAAPAAEVGAEHQLRAHQRGAEKTRGRAGSPTRATRQTASLQDVMKASPALP